MNWYSLECGQGRRQIDDSCRTLVEDIGHTPAINIPGEQDSEEQHADQDPPACPRPR